SLEGGLIPGRPAFQTALALVFLGAALLLQGARPSVPFPAQLFALLAVLVALLALIGHGLAFPSFYGIAPHLPQTGMALHPALLVALLGSGILAARPGDGLTALLLSSGAGGTVARRLLLVPALLPFALGWLRLVAERAGVYNPALGGWLFALSNIAV